MRGTREAEVVSNGVMKVGGQRGSGRDCFAVRQMYWRVGWLINGMWSINRVIHML